ncbi:competence protein CoiA [Bombilactobacillus folatiphilus]|uniref:Competence protein CoiA n=1 Tax=Bombilactobacillus folatiphilus TaxID=2923362 RepID=A0ABY4P7Q1_9LACO|nr:competence protein CoiA family protein [Bombilactobacillus folatiphilus]UQS81733.1 competence protein CoiA [Bombilactobacillus folatiphilus]
MLIAKNEFGKLIYAQSYHAPEKVFCPDCGKKVQLVVRGQQRPYFRHQTHHVGNNETVAHFRGKTWLAKWFAPYFDVSLEYVLDEKQRIDVYVTDSKTQLAIEYQCAMISAEALHNRQQQYWDKGLHPLWIFGEHHHQLNQKVSHLQTILSFNRQWGYYVLYKLPNEDYLRLYYNFMMHPASKKVYWQLQKIRTWPQLLKFQPHLIDYQLEPIDWSHWYLLHCRRPDLQFIQVQNWCYQNRQSLEVYIKKTPSQTMFPIYNYLPCYLPLLSQISGQKTITLPLVKEKFISISVTQDEQKFLFLDH